MNTNKIYITLTFVVLIEEKLVKEGRPKYKKKIFAANSKIQTGEMKILRITVPKWKMTKKDLESPGIWKLPEYQQKKG